MVRTMKTLAAVNVRQYEIAVEALEDYNRAVEMGLQILLRSQSERFIAAREAPRERFVAVTVGSDVGMCGQLNELVANEFIEQVADLAVPKDSVTVLAVGIRSIAYIEDAGFTIEEQFPVPGGVAGITPLVQDLLTRIQEIQAQTDADHVLVFYNQHLSSSSYKPVHQVMLPVDAGRLKEIRSQKWPSKVLPTFTMDPDRLFSALIREYLFVKLYRAVTESLASENAARLTAMQGAESNIQEKLTELTKSYNQQRQTAVTEELLDVVAGFEALRTKKKRTRAEKA